MRHLITQPSRACRARLLIIALLSLMIHQPAFAHGGVDHNNNCFLTVGDTKLRISGYQFQPELEGKASAPAPYLRPAGKHFCHFFPELGQIVLTAEPAERQEKTLVTLELAALSSWLNPAQAFTVIKQQPEQLIDTGLASISQTIRERGIYRLNVTLQDASGNRQQQHLVFLVGIPVTKIMVMIAGGLLVLVIGFAGVSGLKSRVDIVAGADKET